MYCFFYSQHSNLKSRHKHRFRLCKAADRCSNTFHKCVQMINKQHGHDTSVVRDELQLIGFSPGARQVGRGILYNRILCVNDHFLGIISELQ